MLSWVGIWWQAGLLTSFDIPTRGSIHQLHAITLLLYAYSYKYIASLESFVASIIATLLSTIQTLIIGVQLTLKYQVSTWRLNDIYTFASCFYRTFSISQYFTIIERYRNASVENDSFRSLSSFLQLTVPMWFYCSWCMAFVLSLFVLLLSFI